VELRQPGIRPEDRLATAVFVVALFHGLLILGLRFTAPSSDERPLPTLEVLLVPHGERQEPNPEASYISERDQRGAGTARERMRTSLPEASARLLEHSGEAGGDAFAERAATSTRGGSRMLVTATERRREARAGEAIEQSEPEAVPIESRPLPTVGLNASPAEEVLRLRGDPSPDDRLLADTRASAIAAYLDGWKRRIEQVGTLNFPNEARRRSLSGNPVLEVAIRADGRLEQVLVRRSSGHRELDAAAVTIVRLASPFDPFPPAIRERYPLLRFAYEWQFLKGRMGDGSLLAPAPDDAAP
jgi:protein TonB